MTFNRGQYKHMGLDQQVFTSVNDCCWINMIKNICWINVDVNYLIMLMRKYCQTAFSDLTIRNLHCSITPCQPAHTDALSHLISQHTLLYLTLLLLLLLLLLLFIDL